jgi:hypothetical protein
MRATTFSALLMLIGGFATWSISGGTTAEAALEPRPDRVRSSYVSPTDPKHEALYKLLQERQVLEKIQSIFSPFRLPLDLTIKTTGCDGRSNAWYQRPSVTICYEYIDEIWQSMPKETTEAGVTPADAVIGQFFYVVAHEFGHAMFDLLDVPLLGRPEDAADQFAAYLMLHLGKNDARRLIGGAAYSYHKYLQSPLVTVPLKAFSDVHGAPVQRFYNMVCMAYGANPKLFADVVEKKYLPEERAVGCKGDYEELAFAFKQLIAPHLDPELTRKVLDKEWLPDQAMSGSRQQR